MSTQQKYELIVTVVDAVAWPAATVAIVWILAKTYREQDNHDDDQKNEW